MCLKCVFAALASLPPLPVDASPEAQLDRGEEIHRTVEAAMQPAAAPAEDAYDSAQFDNMRAGVNVTNADAVLKLAQAAQILYAINAPTAGVLRTLDLLLAPEPVVTHAEDTQAEAPVAPAELDEYANMPPELAAHIKELRAQGIKVDVVRVEL